MVVELNRAFLRVSIAALARALYTIDFSQYLEVSPARIQELLVEYSFPTSRSNIFNVDTMAIVFRDREFRSIFTKLYVGSATF